MNPADPTFSTPKRKRSLSPADAKSPSPSLITTNLPRTTLSEEDGACGSPRTRVAYRFQGLELGGGAISKLDLKGSSHIGCSAEEEDSLRKRAKLLDGEVSEIPETPKNLEASSSSDLIEDPSQKFEENVQRYDGPGPVIFKGLGAYSRSSSSKLSRAYPSINRLADSKSRGRKRISSLPLLENADTSLFDSEITIVDPDRAALTWHDDEITGHNPSDPEDDGEGINGIGFKPTPAGARARSDRRRQQMAEYKSREMKEARARRSERRKGGASITAGSKEEATRRVRFLDADANIMITTS